MVFPGSPGVTQEREEVVVQGQVTGVEIKPNGRFVVRVKQNPTDEYDASLNTKDQNIAQFLMGQVGQQFAFKCGLSHYTHQATGQPTTSKWINEYGPVGGNVAQPTQPTLSTQYEQEQVHAPAPAAPVRGPREDKDLKITWLAIAKGMAVETFKRLPTDQQTLDNAVKVVDYWARVAIHRSQNGIPEWDAPALDPEDVYAPQPGQTGEVDDIPF